MEQLNILIAEDESLIMIGLEESLQNLGHNVIAEASDGEEMVELALSTSPDLMIVDINLPKRDGISAIKEINKSRSIPSIIVSGYIKQELIDKASENLVFGYLVKPVDESDLKPAIDVAMSRYRDMKNLQNQLIDMKNSLQDRKKVEKAKGIVMKHLGIDEEEAMKFLQKKSRNSNKKLLSVAQEIIDADEVFKI
jgi:AmiR/NasT family two-component response regulator